MSSLLTPQIGQFVQVVENAARAVQTNIRIAPSSGQILNCATADRGESDAHCHVFFSFPTFAVNDCVASSTI